MLFEKIKMVFRDVKNPEAFTKGKIILIVYLYVLKLLNNIQQNFFTNIISASFIHDILSKYYQISILE